MDIIIDPRDIKEKDLPLVVLADDRRGLLGFLIKQHTQANYNHVMEMHRPGYFVSQDPVGFREIPVETYMKDFITLKFWRYSILDQLQKCHWINNIYQDLREPKWMRSYDWLGIVGQFLHIPWLNNPHKRFCSERVAEHLRLNLGMTIPKHPSPAKINEILKGFKEWIIEGYWFVD